LSWQSAIYPQRRLIYTRVTGPLTFKDANAHRAKLATDPSFDGRFAHVLDLRDVSEITLTADDTARLAELSVLRSPGRQAIVAPADKVFGTSRMYYAHRYGFRGHEDIDVCRSLHEACRRLGIDLMPDMPEGQRAVMSVPEPVPPVQRVEHLWSLRRLRDGAIVRCELRQCGDRQWECHTLVDGRPHSRARYGLRAAALGDADLQRQHFEVDGWTREA
jgi:hypothetical protein